MVDWITIIISVLISTIISLASTLILVEYRWRRRLGLILSSIIRYRDLRNMANILSRRPRKRYIVFEVMSSVEEVDWRGLESEIRGVVSKVLGLHGLAESGVKLVYYNESSRRGVLKVRESYKYQVIGLLGLVRSLNGAPVMLTPITVTGSLKRAKRSASP